jgi:transposase
MLNSLAKDTKHIYLAIGATDFRKQIQGLVSIVQTQFGKDPFMESSIFIFCNRKRDSVKVLRYDRNGFVLAQKKLLDKMKFQWPKDKTNIKVITIKQLEWLLEGLAVEQKKAHREVKIDSNNSCF